MVPQVSPWGTVTGRCADSLTQVWANPKATRVGTELKSLVEVPPGWSMVGFDVDSQELRLAALVGDTVLGIPGCTPLGIQVLIGNKATKTDTHSVVAKEQGIARDHVKPEVYGAIYGQGLAGTIGYLASVLPGLDPQELQQLAQTFLDVFKGVRSYGQYAGGLASQAFNQLGARTQARPQKTVILGKMLSQSFDGRDFATTRLNWEVQAPGADFRDLLLVLSRWLYKQLGVEGRVLLTIHDEIRTMVREGQEVRAAWALQTAHLLAWAVTLEALGMDRIPLALAYASEIDVDTVLRKSPRDGCTTPTQPDPIPPGQSWTPSDLLTRLGQPARLGETPERPL
jgi:DNA polymerase gamma 1